LSKVHPKRIYSLKAGDFSGKAVAYWMSREQRVNDNWGLLFAMEKARANNVPLVVIFNLVPEFIDATNRQFFFMLQGLEKVSKDLEKLHIPFILLQGKPEETIPDLIQNKAIGCLVCDFDPLKIKQQWISGVTKKISIPFIEVDSHNIVPCRHASPKQEYGAYTIRPKINKLLNTFLSEFPNIKPQSEKFYGETNVDWIKLLKTYEPSDKEKISWIEPGEKAALEGFSFFIQNHLKNYADKRNDPNAGVLSNLSPWLHFGHISAQRVALETIKNHQRSKNTDAFLEELIIRKELSDNFCFYNKDYDSVNGFPEWARKTLNEHKNDTREHIYSTEEWENAQTHDPLWNASQMQMKTTGKMHGYMRMYWAKKILEWSPTPQKALETAIYLNDKYELDGRDCNGYAGCAWAIGGVHDRAWTEREVFGKIRYMNYNGCKRKFDVEKYIDHFT